MECAVCGITGKRYGFTTVQLDSCYRRAKVYQKCPTTKARLKKRRRK